MSNPSKKKGTAAEAAVVHHAWINGFPHAYRNALSGNQDRGDITLCPGVVVEVKNHAGGPSTGQPAPAVLAGWMAETDVERAWANADHGVLVVKRAGTTDPGRWFAYLPASSVVELLGYSSSQMRAALFHTPMCLNFAHVLLMLRSAGWGEPLDDPEEAPA